MATSKTGDKKLLGIIGEEVRFEASQAAELISAIGAEGAAVTVGLLLAGELKRFVDVLSEFDHQIVAGIRKGLYGEGAKAASSLGDDDRGLGGLEVAMNGVSSSIDKLASRFTEGHNRVDCDDENDEDGEDEEDGEGQVL